MKNLIFIYRGKVFLIRKLLAKDIKTPYIRHLKNQKFLINKSKNLTKKDQMNYINQIHKDKNRTILGIFHKRNLIATSGFQHLNKRKVFIGIFLFNKKFLNKGYGFFVINFAINFIYKFYKKKTFIACINNRNIASIKAFQKAGFIKFKSMNRPNCYQLKIENSHSF